MKTFSLAFDVESFIGAKHRLPKIMEILGYYDIGATFFVTKSVHKMVKIASHELGIHGLEHEDLRKVPNQREVISKMLKIKQGIQGANFIGRMNTKTVEEMVCLGVKYFVHPIKNSHSLYAVRSDPLLADCSCGTIWMVPIPVETYGKSWEDIKKLINITIEAGSSHITILMHPFFDGMDSRLSITENVIRYLISRGFKPVKLIDIIKPLPKAESDPKAPGGLYVPRPDVSLPFNMFKEFNINSHIGKLWYLYYAMKRKNLINRYHMLVGQGFNPAIRLV